VDGCNAKPFSVVAIYRVTPTDPAASCLSRSSFRPLIERKVNQAVILVSVYPPILIFDFDKGRGHLLPYVANLANGYFHNAKIHTKSCFCKFFNKKSPHARGDGEEIIFYLLILLSYIYLHRYRRHYRRHYHHHYRHRYLKN